MNIFRQLDIVLALGKRNILKISDEKYLKLLYRKMLEKNLNIENPQTFNEKLQWLKLNDRKDIYTTMVDKFRVKEYVSDIIGEQYIIPTLGIYNSFNEIDFEGLPEKFVMKCTHDSGSTIVCTDKKNLNKEEIKKKINKALKYNYYYGGREWPYKNVARKILIEKFIIDDKLEELRDYKFFCFNGEAKFFKIDFDRFSNHKANYYDKELNLLEFGEEVCPPDINKNLMIPKDIYKMFELAEKLSNGLKFARIDFYYTNEKIYFGEITFYPASGFGKFTPAEWDEKLGKMIEL